MGVNLAIADRASCVQSSELGCGNRLRTSAAHLVLQGASLIGSGRNGAGNLSAFSLSAALVVGKEEKFVLDDRTAKVYAEDVPDQLAGAVRELGVQLRLLIEEVVGDRVRGAVVLISRAMELVGSGLGDQADLRTCLLYTSPSPRDRQQSRMPSSA